MNRVQNFTAAAYTELSQSSSLVRTKKQRTRKGRVSPKQLFVDRSRKEEKPTLAQWCKLKRHLEVHFHRTSWAFPEGVSFLAWMSSLRPFLSQKTMREEMSAVITSLEESGKLRLRGTQVRVQG